MQELSAIQLSILGDALYLNIAIALIVIFAILEFSFPAQANQSLSGRVRNIVLSIIHISVGGFLLFHISKFLPHLDIEYTHPLVLQSLLSVIVLMFIGDFLFYWYHRAQHKWNTLWQIHELHHSDEELNATSSMRVHFLDRPLQFVLLSFPAAYLLNSTPFLSPIALDQRGTILLPFIFATWLFFNHANLRLHLGRASEIIVGPQTHRIHHSIEPEHQNKNFAQFFPIFDILFGTYFKPSTNEFPLTGTRELQSDASYGKLLFKPFRVWYTSLTKIF